jgi:hypothetical protein
MAGAKVWNHRVWWLDILVVAITGCMSCTAQEAASVDLTQITARMELRRPAARAGDPTQHHGSIEHHRADCDADNQSLVAQTTLVALDRKEYEVGEEPKFEVRITNVGSSSLPIPSSPHMADLQPANAGEKFAYSKLTIELYIGGKTWSSNTGGGVTLYGAETHQGTILTLQPGEWLEVIGKGHIRYPENTSPILLTRDPMTQVHAEIEIDKAETLLTSTAVATVLKQICWTQKQGTGLEVKITGAKAPP